MSDALILIVDDQPQNLQVLSVTLRQAGYQVAAATSGPTALRIVDKRLPDLVLCDVIMPEMDGYEVCRRFKSQPRCRDIPLMFITAMTDAEALQQGFDSGAVDYVTKPFNTNELLGRVRTQLELRQARLTIQAYATQMEQLAQCDSRDRSRALELQASLRELLVQVEDLEHHSGNLSQNELNQGLHQIQLRIRQILLQLEPFLDADLKVSALLASGTPALKDSEASDN